MTKKDFELIARVLQINRRAPVTAQIVLNFAAELRRTNPRFDAQRFLTACGFISTEDGHIIGVQGKAIA